MKKTTFTKWLLITALALIPTFTQAQSKTNYVTDPSFESGKLGEWVLDGENASCFVEENKDNEFHLIREGEDTGLVALEEDRRKTVLDGREVDCPKFLFDMLSDLLVKDENNDWIPAYEFERKFLEKNKKSD